MMGSLVVDHGSVREDATDTEEAVRDAEHALALARTERYVAQLVRDPRYRARMRRVEEAVASGEAPEGYTCEQLRAVLGVSPAR